MHNARWERHGDPLTTKNEMYGMGWRDKLAAIVPVGEPDECWLVERGVDKDGYAHLSANDTDEVLVHRLAVLASGREIPPGYEVDHLCRRRNCANPAHLDPVPKPENRDRAEQVRVLRPTCARGHDRANFYPYGGCRVCKREDYYARRAARGAA
jgi:hypothetical protein